MRRINGGRTDCLAICKRLFVMMAESLFLDICKKIFAKIWSSRLNCLFLQAQGKRRMPNDKRPWLWTLDLM